MPMTQHVQNWTDVPPPNLLLLQSPPSQLITPTCQLLEPKHLASSLTPPLISHLTPNLSENLLALLLKVKDPPTSHHCIPTILVWATTLCPFGLLQILLTEFPACTTALYNQFPPLLQSTPAKIYQITLLLQILKWLGVKAEDLHVAWRSQMIWPPVTSQTSSSVHPAGSSNTAGCFHEPTILSTLNSQSVCLRSHQLCSLLLTHQNTEHSFLRIPLKLPSPLPLSNHFQQWAKWRLTQSSWQLWLLCGLEERAPLIFRGFQWTGKLGERSHMWGAWQRHYTGRQETGFESVCLPVTYFMTSVFFVSYITSIIYKILIAERMGSNQIIGS